MYVPVLGAETRAKRAVFGRRGKRSVVWLEEEEDAVVWLVAWLAVRGLAGAVCVCVCVCVYEIGRGRVGRECL